MGYRIDVLASQTAFANGVFVQGEMATQITKVSVTKIIC